MKRLFLTVSVLIILTNLLIAQQTISFAKTHHNFGDLKEENGKVTHTFKFTNTGDKPIIVQNVRTSCGCTAPEWTRKPIPAGQKGEIKATFNPVRRPGPFNKSITVFSSGNPTSVKLTISGKVIPRPRTILDDYPREIGDTINGLIRLKMTSMPFYKTQTTEVKTETLPILNAWDKDITPAIKNVPKHLKIRFEPATLKPKQEGKIIVTYDANIKKDWGNVNDYLYITVNGKSIRNGRISVSANLVQDFSKLSEKEKANSAQISFRETKFDFGKAKQKTKVEHIYKFSNTGKSDLIIYKIKSSCGCTTVNPEKKVIKPGESSSLKAIFNTGGRQNRQTKYIDVYTNDPDKHHIKLRLTGIVEKI